MIDGLDDNSEKVRFGVIPQAEMLHQTQTTALRNAAVRHPAGSEWSVRSVRDFGCMLRERNAASFNTVRLGSHRPLDL